MHTLSSSPLGLNRAFVAGQLSDVAEKLEQTEAAAHHGGAGAGLASRGALARRGEESALAKVSRDAAKATLEQTKGLATQVVKDMLFNWRVAPGADAVMEEA